MIAFFCNSPNHIMRALYLNKYTSVFNEQADLFIGNMCPDYLTLAEKIRTLHIFENVITTDASEVGKYKIIKLIYGKSPLARLLRKNNYSKIISFNVENEVVQALYNLNKANVNFEYHCVEDAPSIYTICEPSPYTFFHPYWWLRIDKQAFHTKAWWTSCPAYIDIPKSFHACKKQLPVIDINNIEYLDQLNFIFNYQPEEKLLCADVLILEESYYTDGLMLHNADFVLYKKLKDAYPAKKFLVKLHPRTKHNRFKGEFDIFENSNVPWELHVLNRIHATDNWPLLQMGIVSGTIWSDKFLFDVENPKIILAPLFYNKVKATGKVCQVTPLITEKYSAVKQTYRDPANLIIAQNTEDLFAILDNLLATSHKMADSCS